MGTKSLADRSSVAAVWINIEKSGHTLLEVWSRFKEDKESDDSMITRWSLTRSSLNGKASSWAWARVSDTWTKRSRFSCDSQKARPANLSIGSHSRTWKRGRKIRQRRRVGPWVPRKGITIISATTAADPASQNAYQRQIQRSRDHVPSQIFYQAAIRRARQSMVATRRILLSRRHLIELRNKEGETNISHIYYQSPVSILEKNCLNRIPLHRKSNNGKNEQKK